MSSRTRISFLLIVSALVMMPLISMSQNRSIDSLQQLLKSTKQDTARVNVLNKLSEEYDNNMSLDTAFKYANTALLLAKRISNLKGIAKALDNMGNVLSDQGKNDEALVKYLTSLGIKKEIGNKKELAYTYNLIGNIATNNDEALKNYTAALKLNIEVNNQKAIATNYNNIGVVYFNQGDFDKAYDNYSFALNINEKLGDKKGMALDYQNIGECYRSQGKYSEALTNQLSSLQINEKLCDKKGMSGNYNNIGTINYYQLNLSEALKNYILSLNLATESGDKSAIAKAYINIGNVYEEQGNYTGALESQFSSLHINKELENNIGIALNYSNIGIVYEKKGNYDNALKSHLEALKINELLGDKKEIANNYINIGEIFARRKNYGNAAKYYEMGLKMSKEIGNKQRMKESYNAISLLDSTLSNWKSAYDNNKLYITYRDSLINEVNTKKLVQSQMQYEFDKKRNEDILEQEKKNVIVAEEKQRQRIIILSVSIGLIIVIVFSVLLYNRFKLTVKQKEVIEVQKIEVEKQKELVDEKNKQVTDSINYAKRIQTALMPSYQTVKHNLSNSFIIYMPKDIVAGDFYWLEKVVTLDKNEIILFAACDCTGHGVPGALVSVVCNNALNRAVREFNLIQPAAILDKTEEIITENFAKNDLEIKDGMDISLCSLNHDTLEINWAGANNPLWIAKGINKEEMTANNVNINQNYPDYQLLEIKADKQPIGINENNFPFTNHKIQLTKNETVYLFTDGFADQFGGPTGRKKITRKRFKELILSVQHLTMAEQKSAIEHFFFDFKKDIEQIDDILIIGVRA